MYFPEVNEWKKPDEVRAALGQRLGENLPKAVFGELHSPAFPCKGRRVGRDFAPLLRHSPQPFPRSIAAVMQRELRLQESNHSGFVYTGRALLLDMLASLLAVDVTYAREGIPLPV